MNRSDFLYNFSTFLHHPRIRTLFISFNSLKSKVNTCNQCGTVTLGINNTCMNCGADLENTNSKSSEILKKPSETTIEVKAEEIK